MLSVKAVNLLTLSISFISGVCVYHLLPYFPLLVITTVCLALWLIGRSKGLPVCFLFLFVLLGLLYCYLRIEPYTDVEMLLGKRLDITFMCTETKDTHSALIRQDHIRLSYVLDTGDRVRLKAIRLYSTKTPLEPWAIYKAIGSVSVDSVYVNPGHYNPTVALRIEELTKIGIADKGVIEAIRDILNRQIEGLFSRESSAFIRTIVTGSRSDMPQEIAEAFNRTGLAHILSISGAHFGLLMASVFWTVRLFISLLPERLLIRLTLYVSPNTIAALLTMPVVTAYLLLSSMSHPALRAFIMSSLFLIGLLVERQRYLPHSLVLAAFIILLIDPEAITDLSFQLSFLAVIGIAIALRYFGNTNEDSHRRPKSVIQRLSFFVKDSLIISLSATLATAPLVAYWFHYFSLISPHTNLIVAPFIGAVILPLSILSSMVFVVTGWFPLDGLIGALVEIMLKTVTAISRLPFADIAVPAFPTIVPAIGIVVMLALAFIVLPQKGHIGSDIGHKRWLVKGLLAIYFLVISGALLYTCLSEKGLLKVTFLDVGQGDSAVVELPDHKVVVIDTGKNGYALSRFLRYRGIREIDALVISHPQSDHAGGLFRILNEFRVTEVWDNGMVYYPPEIASKVRNRSLSRGDLITGKGYTIFILHPHSDFNPDKAIENNLSLVLKISGNRTSFLFTGDIEKEAITDLIHLGGYLKSSVLKFPHHGAISSLDEDLLRLVSPEVVVISVGRLNRYHFPSNRTLAALQGTQVLRTDLEGAIRFVEGRRGQLFKQTARGLIYKRAIEPTDEWWNLRLLFKTW